MLLGFASERRRLRFARTRLDHLFPYLPHQPGYPETAKRSDLAGRASYGYCASHSRLYWGLKLYVIAAPDGMPVAWCLASPKIGERERTAQRLLAMAPASWHTGPRRARASW